MMRQLKCDFLGNVLNFVVMQALVGPNKPDNQPQNNLPIFPSSSLSQSIFSFDEHVEGGNVTLSA